METFLGHLLELVFLHWRLSLGQVTVERRAWITPRNLNRSLGSIDCSSNAKNVVALKSNGSHEAAAELMSLCEASSCNRLNEKSMWMRDRPLRSFEVLCHDAQ